MTSEPARDSLPACTDMIQAAAPAAWAQALLPTGVVQRRLRKERPTPLLITSQLA